MTLPPNDMLPDIPELFDSHRLDQKINGSMSDSSKNDRGLSIGGHHCKSTSHSCRFALCLSRIPPAFKISKLELLTKVRLSVNCSSIDCNPQGGEESHDFKLEVLYEKSQEARTY